MNNLPVEIQARILWFLRQDAVSLHRIEHVCQLWADIVHFFETYRRLRFRTVKILQRLNMTESFSESMTIQNLVKGHKCKGAIAEKAEKIFLTHMEIIRLKYPMTLQKLHQDAMVQHPKFAINMQVSRDAILQGIGIFLPHGSDIYGDVQISLGINEGDSEMVSRREVIAKDSIRRHAKMCIDHKNGIALWSSNICFPGPGHINEHRKHKRRCLGIHPYRIDFSKSGIEILCGIVYTIWIQINYVNESMVIETPWGGNGMEQMCGEDGTKFTFFKHPSESVRSSIHGGQIPLLFYI